MNIEHMGTKIKQSRKKMGLTQEEFAKKSKLSYSYFSSIERGVSSPSLEALDRIAKVLNLTVVDLLNDRINAAEKRVEEETERLSQLLDEIPQKNKKLAEGLIVQAARLRILLDDNWKDILENGEYEKFRQSDKQEPYDRKRPIVENYDNRDRTYKEVIKQLTDLLPPNKSETKSPKARLLGR
ncbi:helix-turn-helix domain-containing protein [Atopobacter phocae]|uniref:helix-turn-helix domain-containing protein n=1 Tax=Atopobacter phocae TaxID=136492 RepID=UPI00046F3981|nr:helix-turn-helix transcriptional regulator [Atopobacter phocae]